MPNWTRGLIIPLEGLAAPVVFQFNPYEVSIDKAANWHPIPVAGRDQPYLHFGCGNPHKVSFGLEVSRQDNPASFIPAFIELMELLTKPVVMAAGLRRPPVCQLVLGGAMNMTCVVQDVKTKYGAHVGSDKHFTYLGDPYTLSPKHANFMITFLEYSLLTLLGL